MSSSLHPIDKWWNKYFQHNDLLSQDLQVLVRAYADGVRRYVDEQTEFSDLGPGFANPTSSVPGVDIDELFKIVELIFQKQQELDGIPKSERFQFRMADTDTKHEGDVLTWCVTHRAPGLFEQGTIGRNSGKVKELGEHLRHEFEDPVHEGHKILAFGQRFTNFVELCFSSGDADTANQRAIYVENVISDYQYLFQYFGVKRFIYMERKKDECVELQGNRIYRRRLCYHVETEKIRLVRTQTIRELILEIYLQSVAGQAAENS